LARKKNYFAENIRRHSTKFSRLKDRAPSFVRPRHEGRS